MKSHMLYGRIFTTTVFVAVMMVTGCASQPVVQQNRQMVVVPEFYTVQAGESLSSIAAKFNLDYLEIAKLNQIEVVDKIYVHQSLRLKPSKQNTAGLVQVKPIEQSAEIRRENVVIAPVVNPPSSTTSNQIGLSQQQLIVPKPQTTVVQPQPVVITPTIVASGWALPSKNAVIDTFDLAKDKKGVYFGGKQGDPIYAARDGEIVYADNGLKEYGKLILIRHTGGYITAYAHNHQLISKVGDKVVAGQKIAEMGSTGAAKVMLQFQIRLDGKPIDPLTVFKIK